jgi:hypothetical protein
VIKLIREKIEKHENGIIVTDYVGDIVNLLINKPKPYRIVYLPEWDVYGIGDAYKFIHGNIQDVLKEFGYTISKRKINLRNKQNPDWVMTDVEFDLSEDASFEPYNTEDASWEVGGFVGERKNRTYITTGIIKTTDNLNAIMPDLYNKLRVSGLLLSGKYIEEEVINKLKKQVKKYQDDELILIDTLSKMGNEVNNKYTGAYNFIKKNNRKPNMNDIFISGDMLDYHTDMWSNYWYTWSDIIIKIADIAESIDDIEKYGIDYSRNEYPWEEF